MCTPDVGVETTLRNSETDVYVVCSLDGGVVRSGALTTRGPHWCKVLHRDVGELFTDVRSVVLVVTSSL